MTGVGDFDLCCDRRYRLRYLCSRWKFVLPLLIHWSVIPTLWCRCCYSVTHYIVDLYRDCWLTIWYDVLTVLAVRYRTVIPRDTRLFCLMPLRPLPLPRNVRCICLLDSGAFVGVVHSTWYSMIHDYAVIWKMPVVDSSLFCCLIIRSRYGDCWLPDGDYAVIVVRVMPLYIRWWLMHCLGWRCYMHSFGDWFDCCSDLHHVLLEWSVTICGLILRWFVHGYSCILFIDAVFYVDYGDCYHSLPVRYLYSVVRLLIVLFIVIVNALQFPRCALLLRCTVMHTVTLLNITLYRCDCRVVVIALHSVLCSRFRGDCRHVDWEALPVGDLYCWKICVRWFCRNLFFDLFVDYVITTHYLVLPLFYGGICYSTPVEAGLLVPSAALFWLLFVFRWLPGDAGAGVGNYLQVGIRLGPSGGGAGYSWLSRSWLFHSCPIIMTCVDLFFDLRYRVVVILHYCWRCGDYTFCWIDTFVCWFVTWWCCSWRCAICWFIYLLLNVCCSVRCGVGIHGVLLRCDSSKFIPISGIISYWTFSD